jgi:hypothetical protein
MITSGNLINGAVYVIIDNSGTLDFTTCGAADNNIGTQFTCSGTPTLTAGDVVMRKYPAADFTGAIMKGAAVSIEITPFKTRRTMAIPLAHVGIDNVLVGSTYSFKRASDGVDLGSGTASTSSVVSNSFEFFGEFDIDYTVRKIGYYEVTGSIAAEGTSPSAFIVQSVDTNYNASYPAGIASDFEVMASTSKIKNLGTTVYTVNDLYSYLAHEMASVSNVIYPNALSFQTATAYTLGDGWDWFAASDTHYLKGASITSFDGTKLWSSVFTQGVLAAGTTLYIAQNDTVLTPWWSAGQIDILIKVKDTALIDSGIVTIFARKFGANYDHFVADLSGGARTGVLLVTIADLGDITEEVVATYSDITVVKDNPTIATGDFAGTYIYTVTANGHTAEEMYEYLEYICRAGSTYQIDGDDGQEYIAADPAYNAIKADPFGTFSGGVFMGAQGIYVTGLHANDALNYILIDIAGNAHQAATPPTNLTLNSLISGSRVYLYDETNVTLLYNDIVNAVSLELPYTGGVGNTITIKVRNKNYHTFESSALSSALGVTLSVTQIPDAVCITYPAGINDEYTVNTTTKKLSHTSGTTRYTVRQFHSWLTEKFAGATFMEFDVPIEAYTNYEFELLNAWDFVADSDTNHLKTGSIIVGGTLFGNLYTDGPASSETIYLIQNGVKITPWWTTGNINILLRVMTAGVLIDEGIVEVFTRDFNHIYDHSTIYIVEGGKTPALLFTGLDTNNETVPTTIDDFTDITLIETPTTQDIGDGTGPQNYYGTINCAGRIKEEVYEYLKYITRGGSTYQIFGGNGEVFYKINPAFSEMKNGPLATMAGGVLFAQGWWITNINTDDTLNYAVIDENGVSHQVPVPDPYITIINLVAGSRVQLYDLTNSVELANVISAGTTYALQKEWLADLDIRVRAIKVDGTYSSVFAEAQGSFTLSGMNTRMEMPDEAVYLANGIDGATVTGISIVDAAFLCNISIGEVTWQNIFAYGQYWLFTEEGIRDEGSFIEAKDTANYQFTAFKIKNISSPSVPLIITGGYGIDATTGTSAALYDTTGGTIFPSVDHVVAKVITVSGASVITGDIADVPTANEVANEIMTRGLLKKKEFLSLK